MLGVSGNVGGLETEGIVLDASLGLVDVSFRDVEGLLFSGVFGHACESGVLGFGLRP